MYDRKIGTVVDDEQRRDIGRAIGTSSPGLAIADDRVIDLELVCSGQRALRSNDDLIIPQMRPT